MDSFKDYKKYFQIDYDKVISDIMKLAESKKKIIAYNQQQLSEGIDANEKRIETIASQEQNSAFPYSQYTVASRSKQGLQVRNVDLKVSGDFWNTFNVKVTKTENEVIANFNKGADDIRDNFDKSFEFLGLTQNNKENFTWDYFYDIFSKKLKSIWQKK